MSAVRFLYQLVRSRGSPLRNSLNEPRIRLAGSDERCDDLPVALGRQKSSR